MLSLLCLTLKVLLTLMHHALQLPHTVLTRRHLLACGLLGVLGACGQTQIARGVTTCTTPGPLPRWQALAPDVWWLAAARGQPDASNGGVTAQLLLVRDGPKLWLVGSGPTPDFGKALVCAIEQTTGQQVTDIVNTRATPELAMGNVAFAGARLWALPDVAAAMQTRCLECQQRLKNQIGDAGASLLPDRIRAPTLWVTSTLGPFDWRAFERSADERVLALRHRNSGVVIAQGLLWAGDVPDLHNTGLGFVGSLQALLNWAADAPVVGEQGGVAGAAAIQSHIDYITALRESIAARLARGEVWDNSTEGVTLPQFAHLPGYATRHAANVQHVWLTLEPLLFR
jgi:hypothetical protein